MPVDGTVLVDRQALSESILGGERATYGVMRGSSKQLLAQDGRSRNAKQLPNSEIVYALRRQLSGHKPDVVHEKGVATFEGRWRTDTEIGDQP